MGNATLAGGAASPVGATNGSTSVGRSGGPIQAGTFTYVRLRPLVTTTPAGVGCRVTSAAFRSTQVRSRPR